MLDNISLLTKVMFIITALIFCIYVGYKFLKRKYLLSIFNMNFYIFTFALLVASWGQFTKEAWGFLGVDDPVRFYPYLDKIILINCIGFLVYISVAFVVEFDHYKINKVNFEDKFTTIASQINEKYISIILWLSIIGWIIMIIIGGEIPLFGNRMLFNVPELRIIRPFYLILNYIISIASAYFSFNYILTKNRAILPNFIVGVIIILLTANRGPVMFLLLNMFIVWIYLKNNIKKANKLIVIAVLISLVLGVSLSFVRAREFNFNGLIEKIKVEIIYGNTFSDIRDGAYVLKGYQDKYEGFLLGKNYAADIISFIPSSISEFRAKWSYGSFSTDTLFGMKDHYGLRGGWFLEPYINFGYLGVIIIAIINGFALGVVEKIFWKCIICEKNKKFDKIQIIATFFMFITSVLMISSAFNSFYAYVAIVILYLLIDYLFRRFNKCV